MPSAFEKQLQKKLKERRAAVAAKERAVKKIDAERRAQEKEVTGLLKTMTPDNPDALMTLRRINALLDAGFQPMAGSELNTKKKAS